MKLSKVPNFQDYRCTCDGVMVGDLGFKKQLWALDKEFDVVWDWGSAKWEIWKFPGQGKVKRKKVDHKAYHVMTVQTQGRTFRELGADVLLNLQKGDSTRYSLEELVGYFDKMDDNIIRAKEKDFRNHMEAIAYETFDYVRGVEKSVVPRRYGIKESDSKFLLNVPTSKPQTKVFKPATSLKVRRALTGGF